MKEKLAALQDFILNFADDVKKAPKFAGTCAAVGAVAVVVLQVVFRLAK